MKKLISILLGVSLIIGSFCFVQKEKTNADSNLLLENIEALAEGEVEFPALCMANPNVFCIIYADGYFILGNRITK